MACMITLSMYPRLEKVSWIIQVVLCNYRADKSKNEVEDESATAIIAMEQDSGAIWGRGHESRNS